MPTINPGKLFPLAQALFRHAGAPDSFAATVAAALIRANMCGHDSHGLLRLPRYLDKIRSGQLHPAARPEIKSHTGATAIVDGNNGFGQVAAGFATDVVARLAKKHGVGAVTLQRSQHVGRLADYVETIAAAGLVALIFAAGAGPGGSVAPFGGRQRRFGTNPMAWGLPVPEGHDPLVADFSTAAWPEGKVAVARSRGETTTPDTLLDHDGHPTTDPNAFYEGGALLPFGGAKGASLVMFIEVVAGILGGSAPASSPELRPGNPVMLLAWQVDAFASRSEYDRHMTALLHAITNCPPANGHSRVYLPNAIERETAKTRERDGIPIPAPVWSELAELAATAGVPLPE